MPAVNGSALKIQWLRYSLDPATFVRECVYIYDATGQDWVKFEPWPAQAETLAAMMSILREGWRGSIPPQ